MENEMEASGAAADISYDMLRSCSNYQKVFNKSKIPARLCCDANNLPLKSNSIPFVFCYETLHHFPEPGPVVEEIYRVLRPGGYFFFDEEPYNKILHFNLYKGSTIYSTQSKGIIRRAFDRFFSTLTCNEVEHGVIENHKITITQWKDALSCFETKDVWLRPSNRSSFGSELFNPHSYLKYAASSLLGGTISGLSKKKAAPINNPISLYDALVCPSCKQSGTEEPLRQDTSLFFCSSCSTKYPIVDGVVFLFAYDKLIELYPDIVRSLKKSDSLS
jgi:uncharacterized protein YbaR (Trm112 family)